MPGALKDSANAMEVWDFEKVTRNVLQHKPSRVQPATLTATNGAGSQIYEVIL